MKSTITTSLFAFFFAFPLFSQTNVQAGYADGQVWVVWETDSPLPDWYAVYAKPTAFASTNDATFVGRSHKADSLGFGIQNMWSERNHGMDTGPDYNDHWISRIPPTQQTAVDNVAFTESHFRSDQSLPAFFNHRLDPNAHDPGTGLIGINNGDGDNWGAWGGYHRWANLVENAGNWQITAWLESNAVFANDNCPDDHSQCGPCCPQAANLQT